MTEELIRPPVERGSGMDAIVNIGIIASPEIHHEAFDRSLTPEDAEFRGATRRDFGEWR
jgi:hypothetical protein